AICAPIARAQGASVKPSPLANVGIDQRLNEQLPLDLTFRDESGRSAPLRDYFGKRPVVIAPVYYNCPMLCTLVLNGLIQCLNAVPFTVGDQFDVIAVSFDARETPELAAKKKISYLQHYAKRGTEAGWHFLTGDEASVKSLMQAIGFR